MSWSGTHVKSRRESFLHEIARAVSISVLSVNVHLNHYVMCLAQPLGVDLAHSDSVAWMMHDVRPQDGTDRIVGITPHNLWESDQQKLLDHFRHRKHQHGLLRIQ